MPFRPRLAAAWSSVALALGLVLLSATPAAAHDVLTSTAPAADTTVSGDVDEVALTFTEPPLSGLDAGIVISVQDPSGEEVGAGDVTIDGATLRTAADLSTPGAYTVTWRSVSVDGHPVSGSYRFTSTGATVPSASASATATPTPGATPTEAVATPSATRAAAAGHSHALPGAAPWVLGGLAVVVAAGLVVVLLRLRRRSDTGA